MARLHTTPFVWLALLFQVVAVVGALLDFWLEVRAGPVSHAAHRHALVRMGQT